MRIWLEVERAEPDGLTREEVIDLVSPFEAPGDACRAYWKHCQRTAPMRCSTTPHGAHPSWSLPARFEDIDIDTAIRHVISTRVWAMVSNSHLRKDPPGRGTAATRYRKGQRPATNQVVELDDQTTRRHFAKVAAFRAIDRVTGGVGDRRPRLSNKEVEELAEYVRLVREGEIRE